jgi:hypothetical protein
MFTDIKVGDVKKITRTITITEINNEEKQVKIKWTDKFGHIKEQWVTYKMFLTL